MYQCLHHCHLQTQCKISFFFRFHLFFIFLFHSRDQLGIESLNDADAATIACCLTAVDMEFLKNVDLTELDFTGWKKGAGQVG